MKIGTKLLSQACAGEIIVVRAEGVTEPPEAGGVPMVAARPGSPQGDPDGDGFALGKRYELVDEANAIKIELLVTKTGTSTLSWGGSPLTTKRAKPLPASD